jgi:hypothetical protein
MLRIADKARAASDASATQFTRAICLSAQRAECKNGHRQRRQFWPVDSIIYAILDRTRASNCVKPDGRLASVRSFTSLAKVRMHGKMVKERSFVPAHLFAQSALKSATVRERAPCAPITRDCSISAVFEGPEINAPNFGDEKHCRCREVAAATTSGLCCELVAASCAARLAGPTASRS